MTRTFEEMKNLLKQNTSWLRALGCHGAFLVEPSPGVWGFRLHVPAVTEDLTREVAERLPEIPVQFREVPPPRALS